MTMKVQVMSVGLKDMSTQPRDVEKMPKCPSSHLPDLMWNCAGGAGYLLGYNLVKMWC